MDAALWPAEAPASFEAFTKVACVFPLQDWPLLRLRREATRARHGEKIAPAVRGRILELVAEHPGGVPTGVLEAEFGPERTTGWHWSQVKEAAELMVRMGDLVVTARDGVIRLFDLPERALPAEVREAEDLPDDTLRAGLARRAAASLAVMTVSDFAHHYHLDKHNARSSRKGSGASTGSPEAIERRERSDAAHGIELAGLTPVAVEGWRETAYVLPELLEAEAPETGIGADGPALGPVKEARLIGPFDPLLRDRRRAQRIFGFDYTFEAYVPRDKRIYGHYVMGVLSGTELIGRVDLWRRSGELVVNQIWAELGYPSRSVTARAKAAAPILTRQLGVALRLPDS